MTNTISSVKFIPSTPHMKKFYTFHYLYKWMLLNYNLSRGKWQEAGPRFWGSGELFCGLASNLLICFIFA